MEQHDTERQIQNIAERTERIEQILPTLVTKEDLKAFATKEDLKAYATRDEVGTMIREEGERTRRHFDVVAEGINTSVAKIAEGHGVIEARLDGVRAELKADLANHERRITRLEINGRKK